MSRLRTRIRRISIGLACVLGGLALVLGIAGEELLGRPVITDGHQAFDAGEWNRAGRFVWHDLGLIETATDDVPPRRSPTIDPQTGDLLFAERGPAGWDLFQARRTPRGFAAPEPLFELNSPASDLDPHFLEGGRRLVFASDRPGGSGGYDLWVAERGRDGFAAPVNFGTTINSDKDDRHPATDAAGLKLIFASNRLAEDGLRFELYEAVAEGSGFGAASLLESLGSEDTGESRSPALTPDGGSLVFASDREGGVGGYDLYRSVFLQGQWTTPEPVAALNTAGDELDPSFSPEAMRLLYARAPEGATLTPRLGQAERREVFRFREPGDAPWKQLLLAVLGALFIAALTGLVMGWNELHPFIKFLLLSLLVHLLVLLWINSRKGDPGLGEGGGERAFVVTYMGSSEGAEAASEATAATGDSVQAEAASPAASGRPRADEPTDAPSIEPAATAAQARSARMQESVVEPAMPAKSEAAANALAQPREAVARASESRQRQAADPAMGSPRSAARSGAVAKASERATGAAPAASDASAVRAPSLSGPSDASAETVASGRKASLAPERPVIATQGRRVAPASGAAPRQQATDATTARGEATDAAMEPGLANARAVASSPAAPRARGEAATASGAAAGPSASPEVAAQDLMAGGSAATRAGPQEAIVEPGVDSGSGSSRRAPSSDGLSARASSASESRAGAAVAAAEGPAIAAPQATALARALSRPAGASASTLEAAPARASDSGLAPADLMASARRSPSEIPVRQPGASRPLPRRGPRGPALTAIPAAGSASTSEAFVGPAAPPAPTGPTRPRGLKAARLATRAAGSPSSSSRGLADAPLPDRRPGSRLVARDLLAPRRVSFAAPVEAPPDVYAQRRGPQKSLALAKGGGSDETEAAVLAGLRYLASRQRRDGSWGSRANHDKYLDFRVGKTALAVLAFLGSGHLHDAPGPFQDTVRRGIGWLISGQDPTTGHLGRCSAYGHGIGTYALAEAYAMSKDPALRTPLRKAVRRIREAQITRSNDSRLRGGWSYYYPDLERTYDRWPRLSVSVWQIMALKSARIGGISVPTRTFDMALNFVRNSLDEDIEAHRYTHSAAWRQRSYETLPGSASAALFALLLLGEKKDDRGVQMAVEYAMRRLPDPRWRRFSDQDFATRGRGNEYFIYYASLGLFLHGGAEWNRWNRSLVRSLVPSQERDGSWRPISYYARYCGDSDRDRSYTTAMNVLTLEVYYRYFTPLLRDAEPQGR